MKLGVFSDAHFHPWPSFAHIGPDGVNSRLKLTYDRTKDLIRISKENGCTAILFAGDLFHTKTLAIETIDVAVRAFTDAQIPIYGVPGNHDQATFGGDSRHSARALGGKIRWLDNFEGRDVVVGGLKIHGIPYVHAKDLLLQELDKVPKGTDIILMHAGFVAGFMGSDYISDLGDAIDYLACDGRADLVISGHYHIPQLITWNTTGDVKNERPSGNGPQFGRWEKGRGILVPGSLEAHNWGDVDSARGFWIIDTDERKAHFHKLNSPEFVELQPASSYPTLDPKNYYRLTESRRVEEIQELRLIAPNLVIEAAPTSAARPQRAFEVAVGDAPGALVQKYVAASGTPLDQERLIKEGKRLLGCN